MELLSKIFGKTVFFLFVVVVAAGSGEFFCRTSHAQTVQTGRVATIAVPDLYFRTDDNVELLTSTVAHLNRSVIGYTFRIQTISAADITTKLELSRPDFFMSPGWMELLLDRPISTYRIASRKSPSVKDASQAVGSVIVTTKDRTDINTLADLRGKVVAGGLSGSVSMWLAAMNELASSGIEYENFFKQTIHLYSVFPDLMSVLWGRRADAVVLPTCALESMAASGLVAVDELKVINEKTDGLLACRRSTDLYPGYDMLAFDWTDKELVRAVTVGMLTYADTESRQQWVPFTSHDKLNALYRNLEIGPYAYLKDVSIKALYHRHTAAFNFAGFALLMTLFYALILQVQVKRKTADLRRALELQKETERLAKRQREQLRHLERRNVVNQMSSMIAHEIKSPMGAICNFAAVLGFMIPESVKTADIRSALSSIEEEAKRIAGIVDRVRNYSKARKMAHAKCDLVVISHKAAEALKLTSDNVRITEKYEAGAAYVSADALELKLMVLNLLRNASEVKPLEGENIVTVTVGRADDSGWTVSVSDRGAPLDDEAFARLAQMMDSIKPEGLGMGLSIVRGIADSHAGKIEFERIAGGGLKVSVRLPEYQDKERI